MGRYTFRLPDDFGLGDAFADVGQAEYELCHRIYAFISRSTASP